MKTYSLDSDIIAKIVKIVAEKLEVPNLDMEQTEVLTEVVALSVALYFSELTARDPGMVQ